MNQPSTEPEFSVLESGRIVHMGKRQDSIVRDYLALLADLESLRQESSKLVDTSLSIENQLQVLVRSLREMQ